MFPSDAGSSSDLVIVSLAVDSASSNRPREASAQVRSCHAARKVGCRIVTARNDFSARSQRANSRAAMPWIGRNGPGSFSLVSLTSCVARFRNAVAASLCFWPCNPLHPSGAGARADRIRERPDSGPGNSGSWKLLTWSNSAAARGVSLEDEQPAVTLHRGRAVNSDTPDAAIPSDVLRKWQRIVDLLANIMRVPSAVVTKLEPPHHTHYRTIVTSNSKGNPFPVDESFSMEIGTFCETVIKNREPLLVANALEDDQWKSAPEIGVGMVSYLGFPVLWPDGRMFGTICVLDDKTNRYSDLYQEVLLHCRDVLQGDLQTLARLGNELEEQRAHLSELFARVPEAVVMVDRDARITRVNPAFTQIFGYTAEEAIGQRIKDLITPDDRQEEVDSFVNRMVQTGEVFAAETVRRHKNGTLFQSPLFASR